MLKRPAIGHKSTVAVCFHEPFIDFGYRSNHTFYECFLSLFTPHNEIMNVWSHLIGFACVLIAGFHITADLLNESLEGRWVEIVAIETYIVCASLCLFLSSVYHWFGCLSAAHHSALLKLDLTGVALLVAGSYFPAMYYGFYCSPNEQRLHLMLTAGVLCSGLAIPWVEYKINGIPLRAVLMASLVAFGLVPFFHWLMVTPEVYRVNLITGFLMMFFWYGMGFTLYVIRVPECFFPNNFVATHIVPSHTLWHICVLNAVYVMFHFLLKYRNLLDILGCTSYEELKGF